MASQTTRQQHMDTELKHYILSTYRHPQELDAATWQELATILQDISPKESTAIELSSTRYPKGYSASLSMNGTTVPTPALLPLFDLQCLLRSHTGMTLADCERIIKAAPQVRLLLIPSPYTV